MAERALAPPIIRLENPVRLGKVGKGLLGESRELYRSGEGPSRTLRSWVELHELLEISSLSMVDLVVGVTW